MSERSDESSSSSASSRGRRGTRRRQPVSWSIVVPILIVTCIAMLGAIYWVVRTGKL